ncbi:hypothetical protein KIF24_11210 [Micromonospora sp. Llam7]|uniref:hypothetical protein n=1 Tax=Micromonospora tarapacensis TaxID=2835305 RepID=UPI001C83BBBF|nr:hypothetical protein [Micromonospora tarapacensis]MBX7266549.1 hypothetical protein [Micromonospora tarapacensis]
MSGAVDRIPEALRWLTVDRLSATVAVLALLGLIYSWRSAQAAKASAEAARSQADSAREQTELGRRQIELLLQQVAQTDAAHRATRQAQEESLQPMVVVDIGPAPNDRSVLMLSIENIGPSIARNVRIELAQPITTSLDGDGRNPIHEWHIFTRGVKTMPPGHRMELFFDIGAQRFKPGVSNEFTFIVNADGPFGPAPELTYDIDLTPMQDTWIGQTTIGKLVEQLQEVNSKLGSLTSTVRETGAELAEATRRLGEPSLRPEPKGLARRLLAAPGQALRPALGRLAASRHKRRS